MARILRQFDMELVLCVTGLKAWQVLNIDDLTVCETIGVSANDDPSASSFRDLIVLLRS